MSIFYLHPYRLQVDNSSHTSSRVTGNSIFRFFLSMLIVCAVFGFSMIFAASSSAQSTAADSLRGDTILNLPLRGGTGKYELGYDLKEIPFLPAGKDFTQAEYYKCYQLRTNLVSEKGFLGAGPTVFSMTLAKQLYDRDLPFGIEGAKIRTQYIWAISTAVPDVPEKSVLLINGRSHLFPLLTKTEKASKDSMDLGGKNKMTTVSYRTSALYQLSPAILHDLKGARTIELHYGENKYILPPDIVAKILSFALDTEQATFESWHASYGAAK